MSDEDVRRALRLIEERTRRRPARYRLSAVLMTSDAGTPAWARLYNITDGKEVQGSRISTTETTETEVVSDRPFELPGGTKKYRGEMSDPIGATHTCDAIDLIPDRG